ncbi:MAG: DUF2828 family protein [Roseiflexaceae bacterium]
MTTFTAAVLNQPARTANGMLARASTASALVDLFYKVGAMRGGDVLPLFQAALLEDAEKALRMALWSRDVRGGAGERQHFRNMLIFLEQHYPQYALALLPKIPEVGRWDDLLVFTKQLQPAAFALIREALQQKNGLAAKWMPRKGKEAEQLRAFLGFSPKRYRKTLVTLTAVVESQMCAKEWGAIKYEHVPSQAAARYRKAFYRRDQERYDAYVTSAVKGEAKVNAAAIYPHDIIKPLMVGAPERTPTDATVINHVVAQWNALPNYVGDARILPLSDVSGSMYTNVAGSVQAVDISVALGLYLADKNVGVFKDTFLTFSASPQLLHMTGNIAEKLRQMVRSEWGRNTNLHKAIDIILSTAIAGQVPADEMPQMLLVLSDMQFDADARLDRRAVQMLSDKYQAAGYQMPQVVFWNLNGYTNVPAEAHETGVAMVSGFSPSIMKAILAGNLAEFSAYGIMDKAIMDERYAIAMP